jgi:hypothetical protein
VPTWEISKRTEERGEWNVIAKGTADSFEAAKAAALFRAGGEAPQEAVVKLTQLKS